MLNKSQKDINRSTSEPRILKRGDFYLTCLHSYHIEEIENNLSKENRRELILLGYPSINEALTKMYHEAQAYVVKREGGPIIMTGGLFFNEDQDTPQMFAMFSEKAFDNYMLLARGSKMLLEYLTGYHPRLSMTILGDYEGMIKWATWLGFETVGVFTVGENKYYEFIYCNLDKNCVYDEPQRPVIH